MYVIVALLYRLIKKNLIKSGSYKSLWKQEYRHISTFAEWILSIIFELLISLIQLMSRGQLSFFEDL